MRSAPVALTALTALAALTLTTGVAHADGVVADYSNKSFRTAEATVAPAERARIAAALPSQKSDAVKAMGKEFVVLGSAKGSLAKAGDVDFLLLSVKRPVAAEPFPKTAAQVIVAMKGGEIAEAFVLPAERQYARLAGAVDMDGDRSSELLLEGSGYNMGQLIMSLDVVKLGATTSVVQKIPEVYVDACENPVGKKDRSAKIVSLRNGKLETVTKPEKCG